MLLLRATLLREVSLMIFLYWFSYSVVHGSVVRNFAKGKGRKVSFPPLPLFFEKPRGGE